MNTICTQSPPPRSAVILGGGPAGLAVAAACAHQGFDCAVLTPAPGAPWHPSYGAWEDELDGIFTETERAGLLAHRWAAARVSTPASPARRLERPYVRLSTPGLQAALQARCEAAGVRWIPAEAARVEPLPGGQRVIDRSGHAHAAALVIDATGAGALLRRLPGRPAAVQSAYGLLIEVEAHPWPLDEALLMDWRAPAPGDEGPPTFLYAMPSSATQVFVEETSLIAPSALPFPLLRARLLRRLEGLGLRPRAVLAEERCAFSMGGPMPARDQPLLGFGAAAGMVHPATGYQLSRALREAAPFAAALAAGLEAGGPAGAAQRGWAYLWRPAMRAQWAAFSLGAQALQTLSQAELQGFFDAFFELPEPQWRAFMGAALSRPALAATLLRFFSLAPAATRRALARAGQGAEGLLFLPRLAGA